MQSTPESILESYYDAVAAGDMAALRQMMVPDSYLMTLEAYGLQLVFREPAFRSILKACETSDAALAEAEARVGEVMRHAASRPTVVRTQTERLGEARATLHYTENGTPKKLYLRRTETGWKIDYLAGRREA